MVALFFRPHKRPIGRECGREKAPHFTISINCCQCFRIGKFVVEYISTNSELITNNKKIN